MSNALSTWPDNATLALELVRAIREHYTRFLRRGAAERAIDANPSCQTVRGLDYAYPPFSRVSDRKVGRTADSAGFALYIGAERPTICFDVRRQCDPLGAGIWPQTILNRVGFSLAELKTSANLQFSAVSLSAWLRKNAISRERYGR